MKSPFQKICLALCLTLGLMAAAAPEALACSVCYGEPDSPTTKGLTLAITALGAIVMCVLAGAVAFFVQANRRSSSQVDSTDLDQ
jgi:hypothetical protein